MVIFRSYVSLPVVLDVFFAKTIAIETTKKPSETGLQPTRTKLGR